MTHTLTNFLGLFSLLFLSIDAPIEATLSNEGRPEITSERTQVMKDTITIQVGNTLFKAALEANAAGSSLKAMLPLTMQMKDLNSNEKFSDLTHSLPTQAANPGTIHTGDLLLWGSTTVVLFYKSFNTAYSYTKLGKIENPNGLAKALGTGNVTVTFKLQSN